jgi:hypothetical protein
LVAADNLAYQGVQPCGTVSIIEWHPAGHLGDVCNWMKIIAFDEFTTAALGQGPTEASLATPAYPHDNNDH